MCLRNGFRLVLLISLLNVVAFATPVWGFAENVNSAVRFGGWSYHLEDEVVENAPTYNENHLGLGVDVGLYRWGNWHIQFSLNYMKDSWDDHLYAASITFDRPIDFEFTDWTFALGTSVGVQSRSIMNDHNGEFTGFSRRTLPLIMPYARLGTKDFFTLFTVYPQFRERINVADGSRSYRLENPVVFWQLGFTL
ncbi:hypothetical protein [Thaumasiovibrio subtropicus]|uniref:hypothetical protein n=1 Tax=Thaumasiovibrio subtropicus TaxID=1891207 RepID=UPI000B356AA0|nr:hypothetical protein [Thaumasiovibrio subtropicus]